MLEKELSHKRFRKRNARRLRKEDQVRRRERRKANKSSIRFSILRDTLAGEITFESVIRAYMGQSVKLLLDTPDSDFYTGKVRPFVKNGGELAKQKRILNVPAEFSLVDRPDEAFEFLQVSLACVLFSKHKRVAFNYSACKRLDVGAQVFLDIILRDVINFFTICSRNKILRNKFPQIRKQIGATALKATDLDIKKILASVGSLAIFGKKEYKFPEIIPYPLTSYTRDRRFNTDEAAEQKEVETTKLVEYVEASLARIKRTLSEDKLENLAIVIGEAIANAEEHSSTGTRFSIGYFREEPGLTKRCGIFRLVILNFGTTIYEKFKDANCPNPDVVRQMETLSTSYKRRGLFDFGAFQEEELWTLYALQEGVTSVSPFERKRGSGTIRYIESFFDIKGSPSLQDEKSRMTILSGNTSINFDGTYRITEREVDGQKLKVMTFNPSGKIEEKPDKNFVRSVSNYFPGTIISARIFFQEDDFIDDVVER